MTDRPKRPYLDPLPGGGAVALGTVVELTTDERRELAEHSYAMRTLTRREPVGWLGDWAKHHAAAGRVLMRAIQRSHAS